MLSLSQVTQAAQELYPDSFKTSSEYERFQLLDHIASAQFTANHAVKHAYKGIRDRGLNCFNYTERHWVITDTNAMKIAERALQIRYGKGIKLEADTTENLVWVTEWNGKAPDICTEKEIQDRKDGRLFAYVATSQMEKAIRKIKKGANPNAKGPFGRTPIYAVMQSPELLEALILKGASVDVKDDFGLSPLDIAKHYADFFGKGDSPYVRIIKKYEKKEDSSLNNETEQMIQKLTQLGYSVKKK